MKTKQPKIAFYPCCATDVKEPRCMLAGIVDEIIFCDIRRHEGWESTASQPGLPQARFEVMDVRAYLSILPQINVLFYRRDSNGEGGSGIYILSERYLSKIMKRFEPSGGLIITDGSNHGDGILKRMMRPQGYTKRAWNRHFRLSPIQKPFDAHGLVKIEVLPLQVHNSKLVTRQTVADH
jgi:hypothetical protein